MAAPQITFARLVDVPGDEILRLLNEPRNARHMPLAGTFTAAEARDWVAAKDSQWDEFGYGPWAVVVGGAFAGWGGFQHEEGGADFGLVLLPEFWGHGRAIAEAALERGFRELGLDTVLIALPYSRNPDRVVARFGFQPDGEATYGGARFRQYRLTRARWEQARGR